MKSLVLGCKGQLGQALAATAPAGTEVIGLDLPELDITSSSDVSLVVGDVCPSVIINASAYTDVDGAETDVGPAQAVNVDGPRNIANAANIVGAQLIHISTDFVFGGEASVPYKTDSETDPLSIYGRTKCDGESAVLEAMPDSSAVIRTAWLYSKTGANFVKTMLRLMAVRDEIRVVADQQGTPTWANSLADAIWASAKVREFHGIYHWTDAGECTWHEFAVAIQEEALALGLLDRAIPVRSIATEDYPTAARRPRYSVLDCSDAIATLGLQPEPWRANLRRMLKGMEC